VLTRRSFLGAGGLALAGLAVPGRARGARPVEIHMRASERGEQVWFDPIGVWIAPGQTLRWVLHHDVHTTTAYHPKNAQHSLRIPEAAEPWDSGFLLKPGAAFERTFTVEGVYDYYCMPHEAAGMVGRLVVGRPGGPGALPFDDSVPEPARQAFPSVEQIMKTRVVRRAAAHARWQAS
jgi:plastocyanin